MEPDEIARVLSWPEDFQVEYHLLVAQADTTQYEEAQRWREASLKAEIEANQLPEMAGAFRRLAYQYQAKADSFTFDEDSLDACVLMLRAQRLVSFCQKRGDRWHQQACRWNGTTRAAKQERTLFEDVAKSYRDLCKRAEQLQGVDRDSLAEFVRWWAPVHALEEKARNLWPG